MEERRRWFRYIRTRHLYTATDKHRVPNTLKDVSSRCLFPVVQHVRRSLVRARFRRSLSLSLLRLLSVFVCLCICLCLCLCVCTCACVCVCVCVCLYPCVSQSLSLSSSHYLGLSVTVSLSLPVSRLHTYITCGMTLCMRRNTANPMRPPPASRTSGRWKYSSMACSTPLRRYSGAMPCRLWRNEKERAGESRRHENHDTGNNTSACMCEYENGSCCTLLPRTACNTPTTPIQPLPPPCGAIFFHVHKY